jgi:hypothetical protein
VCQLIAATQECRCQPPVFCEDGPYPLCAAPCPDGTACIPGSTLVPPIPQCVCEPTSCETSLAPQCDGPCDDPGQTCEHNAATDECRCNPPLPCDQAPFPSCDLECPAGLICQPDPSGLPECACAPQQCSQSPFPQCDGECPAGSGLVCQPDASGLAQCSCQPVPCEQLPVGATCDGPCPFSDQVCTPLVGGCDCLPEHTCDTAPYPSCDATCPDGEVCVPDTTTDPPRCRCVPPPCEWGPIPTCDGTCPSIFQECEFISGKNFCRCLPYIEPVCQAGPYPSCDGLCPLDTECIPIKGTNQCDCRPIVLPCTQSPYPTCQGDCPVGTKCKAGFGNCVCCPTGPPPHDTDLRMGLPKGIIIWQPHPCPKWWHVYSAEVALFLDGDDDGLPDVTFECMEGHVTTGSAMDTTTPPPGSMHAYLVTAVDDDGESSLGYTTAGVQRTNYVPCF